MVDIVVDKGLDLPITGKPTGELQKLATPTELALNLGPFDQLRFKLLVKVGDRVKIGQPLAYDKACPERQFVSPAGGVIKEVRRGFKRRLLNIIIDVKDEEFVDYGAETGKQLTREELIKKLLAAGVFAQIRQRPYNLLAQPHVEPRCIFVNAVESAPFAPPPELQIAGNEAHFAKGLEALNSLTKGLVHLVYRKGVRSSALTDAENIEKHTVEGPHPSGNSSVHIHHISPIKGPTDVVWTLSLFDVLAIGHLLNTGHILNERTIGIGGSGIQKEKRGYFVARLGHPIGGLIAGRNTKGVLRMISGSLLTGEKVGIEDFLGFYDNTFTVIPENTERQFLHFFRLGGDKFTNSRAYLSGHLAPGARTFAMNTSNHGEKRGFIDASVYQKVMPMQIPVMHLVKSVMAEDWEGAESLGFLEVAAEDFALPTFVCPSKIEMVDIMQRALKDQAIENVH